MKVPNQKCNITEIGALIAKRLGDNWGVSKETQEEVDFFLPNGKTGAFSVLFEELERQSEKLGIRDLRIVYITLDQV